MNPEFCWWDVSRTREDHFQASRGWKHIEMSDEESSDCDSVSEIMNYATMALVTGLMTPDECEDVVMASLAERGRVGYARQSLSQTRPRERRETRHAGSLLAKTPSALPHPTSLDSGPFSLSSMDSVARLILVGGGRIGTVHLNDIMTMPTVHLVAVVEPVEKRRKEMAAQARCNGYGTLQEALEAREELKPEGVMICTPTATHFELVKLALNSGLPVFCEKPVAQHTHEVDEVYALAESKGLPLLCGFQRRFDPSFMKLKKAIADGQIGQVQIVRTTSRDHPLPSFEFLKTSGGIFHDCCSHDIDVHRWLVGEDPIEVYAVGKAWFPEIESFSDYDAVVVLLKFPSGITTTIDLHRNAHYGYDQRIEVMGSKGMVEAHNHPKTSMVLSTESGVTSDNISYSFTDRYPEAYKAEIVHFIDLVRGKGRVPLRVTHQDVRKCGIIADACDKSAHEGKPIAISYE